MIVFERFLKFSERGVWMSKIASEVVATTLNDWYIAIKKQKVDESIKYYSEIKKLFDEMEEDQEVLAYYSLLEERHKMLLHSSRGEPLQSIPILLKTIKTSLKNK